LPPVPVQVSVKLVVAVSGAVDAVPLVGSMPVHPPDALQLVAFVELHVNVDDPLLATVVGVAVNETVGAGTTVTVTVWLALPLVPVQVSVKLVVAVKAAVVSLPFAALEPDQPPEALQLEEFVEFQVSTEVAPLAMPVGLVVNVTVGADAMTTLAVLLALPPAPLHVSVKFVAVVSAPVDWLPLVGFAPLQPPDAVQLVASVELHVSVTEPPLTMLVGFVLRVTVGAGATVTVTLWLADPPAPEQVSEKPVVAASGEVDSLPLMALAPLQPPEAVQLVALVELHVSVAEPPPATEAGLAVSVTVGAGATVTLTV